MEGFMTAEEAARYLNRSNSLVCRLCKSGRLDGAKKVGQKVWLIPEKSVMEYKPGPQGFAALKARKLAKKEALMAQFKEAAINGGIAEPILD